MTTELWSDLKTDDERPAFFLSGRAYETGVVCHSIQNDLAMAYHRLAEMQKELRRLDALNAELVEAVEAALSDDQPYIEKCRAALAKAKEQA